MRTTIIGLSFLTLSFMCGIASPAATDEAADRAALEAASQSWIAAFNARDADAMAALATEDVIVMMPDASPVSGRQKARAAWGQSASKADAQISSVTKEIAINGHSAWRIGALVSKSPNGMTVSRGQTLEIWKRVDGRWKLHRMMTSGNLTSPSDLRPRPQPNEPVLDTPKN